MNADNLKTIEVPGVGERNQHKSVKVLYDDGDEVQIVWLCGDSRTFSKKDLQRALLNFMATAKIDSMFYQDMDSKSAKYVAHLVNGKEFTADSTLSAAMSSAMACDWTKLRDALAKASGYEEAPAAVVAKPKAKPKAKPRQRVTTSLARKTVAKPKTTAKPRAKAIPRTASMPKVPKPRAKAKPRAKKPPN